MRTALLVTTLLLAGLVAAPFGQAAEAPSSEGAGPEPIAIHPCFQPGTFNVVILGHPTGCIGAPPGDAEARPDLIEVYPCFRPGTYYVVIAGLVATGCIGA